jgi:hypothetical protein
MSLLLLAFIGSVVLTGAGALAFALIPNAPRSLRCGALVLSALGVTLLALAVVAVASFNS